jgi:queuine tRNA-ribosyltransferase
MQKLSFSIENRLPNSLARAGTINTPHGPIKTPAFIVVGTKATVKAVLPESIQQLGAQAVLANAYHLFLQPGENVVAAGGGVAKFMGWDGPTFTDSGGFQVMSLGFGYKKVLAMKTDGVGEGDVIARIGERQAKVDDNGVTFKSHIDGTKHTFTPERSIQIQHALGADIIFAFDECTSLLHTKDYQARSIERRTQPWAERCLAEMVHLRGAYPEKSYQGLFGVVQGAQFEDLRRSAAAFLGARDFDGFGIGGALEKERLGTIVRWVNEELPEGKPRHLLGISEPDDLFAGVENGIDTFDCVAPTRVGRNGTIYTPDGPVRLIQRIHRQDFGPLAEGCGCYTCTHHTRAYVHHLFKAHEMVAATLASIHNEYFIVHLVDQMRETIMDGSFFTFKDAFLSRYYRGR